MRGTQVKKIRRMARQMADPSLIQMRVKRMKSERYGSALTAFWPNGSFRRLMRSAKKWYRLDPEQRKVMLEMGARK
jgi:hypothetical protein